MTFFKTLLCGALPLALATPLWAESHMQPVASALVTGDAIAGDVTISKTASDTVLVRINLNGVPEGEHGVHLHETGACDAPDFKSAGGHIAGDHQHGVLVEGGPHPGDMPNMTVGSDGILKADVFLTLLDVDGMIMDDDGAAFIVHSDADDYTSQPAGEAGSRIACGVFEPAS